MSDEMSNITQLAFNAINDEQLIYEKYLTPESVLDYLLDKKNFKSLSDILIETMQKANICNVKYVGNNKNYKQNKEYKRYIKTYINKLFELLERQDEEDGRIIEKEKRCKKTVQRWFNGETKCIRNRYEVIEICFALKLDLALSTSLLNKCGYNGFNVRNAEDATYLYCILNKRPLFAAISILSNFENHNNYKEEVCDSQNIYNHSGQTTILLENEIIENSNWESDDSFLNSFLIPQKSKFIDYSYTAITEYYRLKNILYINVFIAAFNDEEHLVFLRNTDKSSNITAKDIPVSFAVRSALKKHNDESSILCIANQMLRNDMSNTKEVLCEIRKIINKKQNIYTQKQISVFLNDIMKIEGLLKFVIDSIRGNNGRIRKYRESALNGTLMNEFPDDHSFANFEKDPTIIYKSQATRKAIVLMYYISYAYEFSSYISDYSYSSSYFGNMGFSEFMEGLNKLLSRCNLSPLYPANQYDWLILRSIREFEISDAYDEDSPVKFFNDVLAFSFGDNPDE